MVIKKIISEKITCRPNLIQTMICHFVIIHVNNFSYRFFMFDMTEEDVIEFINDFEPDDEFEAMLQYERIGLSEEEIDNDKTSLSYECMICRYWYFKVVRFKFESNTCNKCSDGCLFKSKKKRNFKRKRF